MEADVRLVKLCRKAISTPGEKTGQKTIMATDYFDVVEIKKFSPMDSLMNVMGTGREYTLTQDDVSLQSYPLYCDGSVLDIYNDNDGYEDPFEEKDNEKMPFLSIIQVHITPEVMARISVGDGNIENILKMFSKDLHWIVDEFIKLNAEIKIKYRIYQTLSAGDFSVIVKAENADTSFLISTLIRKRVARNQNQAKIDLVLYKTYTILSINESLLEVSDEMENVTESTINPEDGTGNKTEKEVVSGSEVLENTETSENGDSSKSDKNSAFVIRCCFSNKYWSEKSQIESELAESAEQIKDKIYRLNGRYDFSVHLDEQEFRNVYPIIMNHKVGNIYVYQEEEFKKSIEQKLQKKEQLSIEEYLVYLLEKEYLSYVNERYLFKIEGNEDNFSKESPFIEVHALQEPGLFLNKWNEDQVKEVLKRFENVNRELNKINGYRKNLKYYMTLLERLIILCGTINGLSDTRIYAALLLRQLEIVLNNLEAYTDLCRSRGINILNLTEDYLRESVCALDNFARYIRDNNLQSLQTPNYSLESNVGMEKLLIGYSQFLEEIIDWYKQTELCKEIGGIQQEFLPILLPDLSNKSLAIEVMFPKIIEEYDTPKRLMVVKCPTLNELANVSVMVAALFHEVAHQFRYETREKRNNALFQYCIFQAFNPIVRMISNEFKREIPGLMECNDIEIIIGDTIAEVYKEICCKMAEDEADILHGYENMSLSQFNYAICKDIEAFLESDQRWEELSGYRDAFLEEIRYQLNVNDPDVREALKGVKGYEKKLEKMFENKADEKQVEDVLRQVITYIYILWMKSCKEEIPPEDLEKIKSCDISEGRSLCRERFNEMSADKSEDEKEIFFRMDFLVNTLSEENANSLEKVLKYKKYMSDFEENLYKKLCEAWQNDERNVCRTKYGRRIGRYLGVDYGTKDNETEFKRFFKSKMTAREDEAKRYVNLKIKAYREQTSDMFMCKMLNLTPFGYINFMAYNLPIDQEVPNEYLTRFTVVLYSIWGNIFNNPDSSDEGYLVFKRLKESLQNTLRYYEEQLKKYPETKVLLDCLNEKDTSWKTVDEMKVFIVQQSKILWGYCIALRKAMENEEQNIREEIESEVIHYQFMCKIWGQIVANFDNQKETLEHHKTLREDLKYGAKKWGKLHQSFKKTDLWTYCEKVAEILNNPSLRYNQTSFLDNNCSMILFIQNMFYRKKLVCAREIMRKDGEE